MVCDLWGGDDEVGTSCELWKYHSSLSSSSSSLLNGDMISDVCRVDSTELVFTCVCGGVCVSLATVDSDVCGNGALTTSGSIVWGTCIMCCPHSVRITDCFSSSNAVTFALRFLFFSSSSSRICS